MLLKAEPALTGLLDFPPCALTLPLIRCSSFNVGSARLLLSFYFLFDWVLLNVWLGSLGFSTWNTAFGLLTNNFPPRIICCSFLFSFSSVICFFSWYFMDGHPLFLLSIFLVSVQLHRSRVHFCPPRAALNSQSSFFLTRFSARPSENRLQSTISRLSTLSYEYYPVLLSFIGFYRVLPGFTGFYWVLLGFTGFYWVLLGFTGC